MTYYYVLPKRIYRVSAYNKVDVANVSNPENFIPSIYSNEDSLLESIDNYSKNFSVEFQGDEREFEKFKLGLELLK